MKTIFSALFLTALGSVAVAAPIDQVSLTSYARRALPKCPDSIVTVERLGQQGVAGFEAWGVKQTSSDNACGSQKVLLVSPTSRQVLMGNVFALPPDSRPVDQRVTEQASELLKLPVKAVVSPFPLPDRLKQVSIVKNNPLGQFAYHGYVDGSERFLIVGSRGNLNTDPGKTLLEALGVTSGGVFRGSKTAKNEIIELSDFQCPTCGHAHQKLEPIIAKHLRNVRYTRLDLPLFEHHEWAFNAALGARAIQRVAPGKYWTYVNYVFANQEEIGKMPSYETFLKNFCDDRDISWKAVSAIFKSASEKQALLDQVSHAFDNGIVSTPTYIINGQIMGFGPEGKFTIDAVKAAVGAK